MPNFSLMGAHYMLLFFWLELLGKQAGHIPRAHALLSNATTYLQKNPKYPHSKSLKLFSPKFLFPLCKNKGCGASTACCGV